MQRIHAGQAAGSAARARKAGQNSSKTSAFRSGNGKAAKGHFLQMDKKHIGSACRKTFLGGLVSAAFPQQAVPGDRRGGFANLVCLPVAPKAQGKRVLAEKDGAAGLSRHAKNAGGEPIRHAERLRIRLFRRPALYILLPVCYICQQSGAHVPPIIRREAAKKEGQTG